MGRHVPTWMPALSDWSKRLIKRTARSKKLSFVKMCRERQRSSSPADMFVINEAEVQDQDQEEARVEITNVGIRLTTYDVVGEDLYITGQVLIQRCFTNPNDGWVMFRFSMLEVTIKLRILPDGTFSIGERD